MIKDTINMLPCQIKTDNKDVFLCKRMGEKTTSTFQKVHTRLCNTCQNDKEGKFSNIEFRFYVESFFKGEFKDNAKDIKDYFIINKKRSVPHFERFVTNKILSVDISRSLKSKEILEKIKDMGFKEIENLLSDEEEAYKLFKKNILLGLSHNSERIEKNIGVFLSTLSIRKDIIERLIREEEDKFSKEFLGSLDEFYLDYDENIISKQKNSDFKLVPKVSITDRLKGAASAFKRAKKQAKKEGKETLWVSEKESTERQVCCTTCTDGGSCPYCGCSIKKSWFLPLGKSELSTEGCPNKTTYPHLKKLPPKNYWGVTQEKTSVIISAKNEKHINKTINSLIKNATGDIEILVGLDGYKADIIENDIVTVLYHSKHIGRRKVSNQLVKLSTGKYLFEIDSHCAVSYGWDTKLKCVCDDNTIVGCSINSLNEETWEGNDDRWVGGKVIDTIKWEWDKINDQKVEKVEEVESFNTCGWMIRRDYFDLLNGHDEELGEWGWENVEWTLKNKKSSGKIIVRTDVVVSHLFREYYPYEIKGRSYENVLNTIKDKYISY